MKVSLSWLSEYIQIPFTPEELDHRLTMLGLEIEGIENLAKKFDKIVIGEVLEVTPHPNADKLRLTRVDVGNGEPLRIVCGAPNVRQGLKVAVATIGADLGEGFVIKKSKIRGEASEGMLCSERELGISESHEGIWELPSGYLVGTPLATALGKEDVTFEVGITANRPDCLSHIGIAREIAAITDHDLKIPQITLSESDADDLHSLAKVTIADPELCPRYVARVVRGVRVQDSPEWLKRRLEAIGLRPINNIVDITNFVLMECGHPLHAFDLSQVKDGHIVVRRAEGFAEEFTTLDSKSRKLHPDTLLIADPEKSLAIAGIMGGENSEISLSTTDVLIESAYFNPTSIRRSGKRLGLSTDASYRFERGTDVNILNYAVDRASQLMEELGGGTLLPGRIDVYPNPIEPRKFRFRPARANALLGTNFSYDRMREVLNKLSIEVDKQGIEEWVLTAPSFRVDIAREEDAIEEIARVIGYEEIPTAQSERVVLPTVSDPLPRRNFDELVRSSLLTLGLTECVSTPLVSEKEAALHAAEPVHVINPLNIEMKKMRSGLVGNLLEICSRNERFGAKGQRLFEVGNVFSYGYEPGLVGFVHERPELTILLAGILEEKTAYNAGEVKTNIFSLKGLLENFFGRLGLRTLTVTPVTDASKLSPWSTAENYLELGTSLEVRAENMLIAIVGSVNATLRSEYDLRSEPLVAIINYKALYEAVHTLRAIIPQVKPLPKYPAIERDIAVVLSASVLAQDIENTIRALVDKKLLREVRLFDEFRSKEMKSSGERSLAFHLVFRADERTLEEAEIDTTMENIIKALGENHGAKLRT